MQRFALGCGFASLAILALGMITPAHADFYSLDGRFQCLDHANTVCGNPEPLVVQKPPALPAATAPLQEPVAVAVMPPRPHFPPPVPRSDDPLHEIALRVEAQQPRSGDIAWLRQAAERGNPRAMELLAWCDLNAVGTERDAVKAYLLYGAAADAALPHAHENQAVIYESDLTSNQRQQVLELANEGVALAQLSPAAR